MDRCKAGALPLSYTPTELPLVKEGGAAGWVGRPSLWNYSSLEPEVSWGRCLGSLLGGSIRSRLTWVSY